jgi:hypothetical protein
MIFLVVGFADCNSASRNRETAAKRTQDAAAKIRGANDVLAQSTKTGGQWTAEYMKAFNPQSRSQFPGNRDSLQTSAEKILPMLDEHTRLSNEAIRQYEDAMGLISDDQQRKGMGLIVSALKKSLESDEMFRSQMRLVSDQSIVDEKTFNEKFLKIATQIGESRRDSQAQFEEGRRLMGL